MVGLALSPSVLTKSTFLVPRTSVDPWHFNWRASEASESLSGVTKGNRRYIYIYIYIYIWYVQDTLVARARCHVMWEELSVSHF